MLCERCGERPAVVHITEIINNKKREMHLCQVCAQEVKPQGFSFSPQGFAFSPQLNLHNFLSGLLDFNVGTGMTENIGLADKCEYCGLSEKKFIKSGLLGCSRCYDYFGGRLQPLLRKIQGTDRHTGKVPKRTGGKARLNMEIRELKSKLQEAVAREEFEKAAVLRDKIRDLEKKIKRIGGRGDDFKGNCK